MADYLKIPTSPEVWAVIRSRHGKEMGVYSSFSDPDGTFNGGPGERGEMQTAWALPGADFPIIEARTTWDIDPEQPHKRINERSEYWIIAAKESRD